MIRRRPQPAATEGFPGFTEVQPIGQGTFADVYRGVETSTGRSVALKILKVAGRQHLMEAFDQEVRALAAVSNHPNIVTMYRPLSLPDGRPGLVLELCRESLAQRVRRDGPLPAREVVAMGIKLAGAIETAHRAGFLHRDVKPQNILVTQFGEPALADFGVAALQAVAEATEGTFTFTTLHAPPEVFEGGRLSPATDVYGLASSMYQLLTGQPPFSAFAGEAPASVFLRILRDPVPPLRGPAIPVALSDLLVAALAKSPSDRPAGAASFADALRRLDADQGWPSTLAVIWGQAAATLETSVAPDEVPSEGPPPLPAGHPIVPSVLVVQAGPRNVVDPVVAAWPRPATGSVPEAQTVPSPAPAQRLPVVTPSPPPPSPVAVPPVQPPSPPVQPAPVPWPLVQAPLVQPAPVPWIAAPLPITPDSVYEKTMLPGGPDGSKPKEGSDEPGRQPRRRLRGRKPRS